MYVVALSQSARSKLIPRNEADLKAELCSTFVPKVLVELMIDKTQVCILSDGKIRRYVMQNVVREVQHTGRHDNLSS